MDDAEDLRVARAGAIAGLCPSTEANLGDGLFDLGGFLAAGGAFGIGSDSHVSISPIEELRWLEYGQRLRACVGWSPRARSSLTAALGCGRTHWPAARRRSGAGSAGSSRAAVPT